VTVRAIALSAVALLVMSATASAQPNVPAPVNTPATNLCESNTSQCGLPVPVGNTLVGPSNGNGCITSRIVDMGDVQRGTDFLPVCANAEGVAIADGVGDDGLPSCTPFPPGRIPPAWGQTTLPTGGVEVNPAPEAATGMEAWFWYSGPTSHSWPSPVYEGRTADCRILPAPARVSYSATLASWRYAIGDSRPLIQNATHPGTEADPAARHTFRTKGSWGTTVTCTWSGSPAGALEQPCGQRTIPVIEIRTNRTE
jgi:hypothetical protein